MSKTNSNDTPNRLKLKVVPSTAQPESVPPAKTAPTPPPVANETIKSGSSFNYGRLLFIVGLVAAGAWVSQLPIPNSVRTEARLEPLPDSHRFVYMQIPGSVSKFWVNPGDAVKIGQPVAEVVTLDLDSEIIQKQAKLQEQESAKAAVSARIPVVEGKLEETLKLEMAARRQVEETSQEIKRISDGNPPPEIQKLQAEIKAISTKIPGIEAKITSLQQNLQQVEESIAEYEKPALQELMPRLSLSEKLRSYRERKATLLGDIQSQEQEIKEIQHQISAKSEEIETAKKKMQQELALRQDDLASKVAIKQTAIQELAAAKKEVAYRKPAIQTLKAELEKLRSEQQKNKILESPISGIVVSQNLHEKIGKKMTENQEVLEVANLDKLVALIEVPQTDSDLVKGIVEKPSATVVLQPLEPGLPSITTRIEKIEPVLQPDASGQKQLLRVRAMVDNQKQYFQPNAKVYAQIEVEPIPLYQRVQREFMKLFKVRKYV